MAPPTSGAQRRSRIPLGRRGVLEDVAESIVRLVDPASEWMTGHHRDRMAGWD